MTETRRVDSIKIGDRVRRDLGDLTALKRSIETHGALLQPIVIRPDGTLIAGARRLEAYRQLDRSQIEVNVRADLASAVGLLVAERDENTCRLDMTASEKVALGRKLEELERPRAAERMAATQAKPGERVGGEKFTPPSAGPKGKTRDLVGAAVGLKGPTYTRAKAVVTAAETGDPLAIEARDQMDRTGKVTPAYERLTGKSTFNAKPIPRDGTASQKQIMNAQASRRRIEELVGTCQAYKRALHEIRVEEATIVATADEVRGWQQCLQDGEKAIRAVRARLKGLGTA